MTATEAPGAATGRRDIVLDTNILLAPFVDGTDLEADMARLAGAVRLVVPSAVLDELRSLQGPGRSGAAARAAATLVQRCHVEPASLPGDDGVLEVATRLRAAVASNDRRLLRECRRRGIAALRLRGGRLAWA